MTARQHHYVPQCYLKGFVANRNAPKLFVVDAKERRSFTTHPRNVAVERDFHAVDFHGLPPDSFENDFSSFETKLDETLRRIAAARSLKNEDDRAYLFNLIGLMATKNPRLRATMSAARERTARIIMDMATATPEAWAAHVRRAQADGFIAADADADYAKMREFFERGQFTIETTTTAHLQTEMKTFDSILPLIFRRKWVLYKAPPGAAGFVTSDHPMCLMWADPTRRGKYPPPGLGLARTQLLFPISNELATIGAFELDEEEVEASELLTAQINGSIILHASRQVYARDDSFAYKMQHNPRIMRGSELLQDQAMGPPRDSTERPRQRIG